MSILSKKKKKILKQDGGFTLIEIAVVLLIISILTAAIITHLNGSIHSANITAVKQQILSLQQVAHEYAANTTGQPGGPYVGLGSYTSGGYISGQTSLLPSAYTSSGIPNAFGGNGILTNASNGNPYEASITETGLPSDACTQLAASFLLHAQSSCSGNTLTITFQ